MVGYEIAMRNFTGPNKTTADRGTFRRRLTRRRVIDPSGLFLASEGYRWVIGGHGAGHAKGTIIRSLMVSRRLSLFAGESGDT